MKLQVKLLFSAFFTFIMSFDAWGAEAPSITVEGVGDDLRSNILSHLRISGENCDVGIARLLRLQPQVRANTQRASIACSGIPKDSRFERQSSSIKSR